MLLPPQFLMPLSHLSLFHQSQNWLIGIGSFPNLAFSFSIGRGYGFAVCPFFVCTRAYASYRSARIAFVFKVVNHSPFSSSGFNSLYNAESGGRYWINDKRATLPAAPMSIYSSRVRPVRVITSYSMARSCSSISRTRPVIPPLRPPALWILLPRPLKCRMPWLQSVDQPHRPCIS